MVREESTNVSCNNSYAVAVSQARSSIGDRDDPIGENRIWLQLPKIGLPGLGSAAYIPWG
jgi:hypothetical protein